MNQTLYEYKFAHTSPTRESIQLPSSISEKVFQKLIDKFRQNSSYAVSLRLLRQHQLGRIYETLYLCRRWAGNTDAALSQEQRNRNDQYKDKIRTIEILARQKFNRKSL